MPVSISERRQFIRELKALDPAKWASLIEYHREQIRREEGKQR